MEEETIQDYIQTFIQRFPKYGVKTADHGWITRNKPLADPAIKAHLSHKYTVGGLSPWYPQFAILDLDDKEMSFVEEIRAELGLDESNSMLMASESSRSYHCIFRPTLDDAPPTRYQLTKSFKTFASSNGVEIYPQINRVVRLPFGKFSKCLDYEYANLSTWQDKLYWFNKLDDFSISTVKGQQYELPFGIKTLDNSLPGLVMPGGSGWYGQGAELFRNGLQGPSTRHEGQAKVIYYLWRQNVPYDEAINQTWAWIKHQHNGFSKDIVKYAPAVKKEIQRQATHIYTNYQWSKTYPDTCHNVVNGFICKPDMKTILEITKASIPKSRFLFHIVKYSYPRRDRKYVPVHSDKLKGYWDKDKKKWVKGWAGRGTADKYLNELESMGLVERGEAYSAGRFSKNLKLAWDYKSSSEAVIYNGRSIDTFEGTVKQLFEPDEFRAMLRGVSNNKSYIRRIVKSIYEPVNRGGQKVQHI